MKERVISAFLALLLGLMVVANLPESELRRTIMKPGEPVLRATGTTQLWSVFAPDPSEVVIQTEARFTYADGTAGTWAIEKRNPLIGAYRDYRWLKLGESVELQNVANGVLRYAIARHSEHKPLERAELVLRVRPIAKPGRPEDEHPPFEERVVAAVAQG